jgi:uncharacterized protein YqhQ
MKSFGRIRTFFSEENFFAYFCSPPSFLSLLFFRSNFTSLTMTTRPIVSTSPRTKMHIRSYYMKNIFKYFLFPRKKIVLCFFEEILKIFSFHGFSLKTMNTNLKLKNLNISSTQIQFFSGKRQNTNIFFM